MPSPPQPYTQAQTMAHARTRTRTHVLTHTHARQKGSVSHWKHQQGLDRGWCHLSAISRLQQDNSCVLPYPRSAQALPEGSGCAWWASVKSRDASSAFCSLHTWTLTTVSAARKRPAPVPPSFFSLFSPGFHLSLLSLSSLSSLLSPLSSALGPWHC